MQCNIDNLPQKKATHKITYPNSVLAKHKASCTWSMSSRKMQKCWGENLVSRAQYMECQSIPQSLIVFTKSQIKSYHPCVDLKSPCTNSSKGKTQQDPIMSLHHIKVHNFA